MDTATVDRPSGPLADAGLLDAAVIYDTLYKSSQGRVTPRDADDLELWEIAVIMGLAKELAPTDTTPKPGLSRSQEMARRRMAHARGNGPKPEAKPMDRDAFNQLNRMLG